MKIKQQIIKSLEQLPDDSGIEKIKDRICVLQKVHLARAQIATGKFYTHQEAKVKLIKWLKC